MSTAVVHVQVVLGEGRCNILIKILAVPISGGWGGVRFRIFLQVSKHLKLGLV